MDLPLTYHEYLSVSLSSSHARLVTARPGTMGEKVSAESPV